MNLIIFFLWFYAEVMLVVISSIYSDKILNRVKAKKPKFYSTLINNFNPWHLSDRFRINNWQWVKLVFNIKNEKDIELRNYKIIWITSSLLFIIISLLMLLFKNTLYK
jgi:hypothetical protein